jgi:hypothetical protein
MNPAVARGDHMLEQGPGPVLADGLTGAEADRRKAILGLLSDALAARRIRSALAGRHILVLCSEARDGEEEDRSGEGEARGSALTLADPQLYIFGARGIDVATIDIVTTDGESYRFASGRIHPAADPRGAAQSLS